MLSLGGQAQGFFLGEHFERTGFFPVRSWRQRWLQVGHGAPPRAAEGRDRRGVARAWAVLGGPSSCATGGGGQRGVSRAGGQPA